MFDDFGKPSHAFHCFADNLTARFSADFGLFYHIFLAMSFDTRDPYDDSASDGPLRQIFTRSSILIQFATLASLK